MNDNKILILGIGNLIMGDEGVGIHVVKALEKKQLPFEADLLDGGTGGFTLLSYFLQYPKIILIDAVMDRKPAGTISLLKPRFSSEFPKLLSAHDIGLKDLIESVSLIDKLPEIYLITISIDSIQHMTTELSANVNSAVPNVLRKVEEVLKELNQSNNI